MPGGHVFPKLRGNDVELWKLVAHDIEASLGEVEYIDLRADGMVVTRPQPPADGDQSEGGQG